MSVATQIENLFMSRLRQADPLPLLQSSIVKNYQNIVRINQYQLFDGEDAKGQKLAKYKKYKIKGWEWYAGQYPGAKAGNDYDEFKNQYNPRPGFGNPDYHLSGDWYKSFKLKVDLKGTEILSDADKTKFLQKRSPGSDIFGIQPENLPKVGKAVLPELQKAFKQSVLRKS